MVDDVLRLKHTFHRDNSLASVVAVSIRTVTADAGRPQSPAAEKAPDSHVAVVASCRAGWTPAAQRLSEAVPIPGTGYRDVAGGVAGWMDGRALWHTPLEGSGLEQTPAFQVHSWLVVVERQALLTCSTSSAAVRRLSAPTPDVAITQYMTPHSKLLHRLTVRDTIPSFWHHQIFK